MVVINLKKGRKVSIENHQNLTLRFKITSCVLDHVIRKCRKRSYGSMKLKGNISSSLIIGLFLHTRKHTEKLSSGRVGIINLRLGGRTHVVLGDLLIRHE